MSLSPSLNELIQALRCLPGVGLKSAQRMAFHLLSRGRNKGLRLASSLENAITHIRRCEQCNNFSDDERCSLCRSEKRNQTQLCIVESPLDVLSIEQTACYQGQYFVLSGHLSPLDGIGPDDIGIQKLVKRIEETAIKEIILATNPTVEGEATAHYIAELLKPHPIKISRIAHGVPLGGELEFVDSGTLTQALTGRKEYSLED